MLNDYQISAVHQAGWVLAVPLLTALGYFAASSEPKMGLRIVTASPGLVVILAFVFAVAIAPWTNSHSDFCIWIFSGMMLLALAADFGAIYAFEGKKWIHFLQLLLIPCLPWLWLIGGLTITHDWP